MTDKPTVAVIGLGGNIGPHALNALTSDTFRGNYKLPIRALTRDPSKQPSNPHVEYYNSNDLETALKGVDVCVDLTGVDVDSTPTIDAAAKAGVKTFIPSDYSADHALHSWNMPMQRPLKAAEHAEKSGMKAIRLLCGAFAEYLLDQPEYWNISIKDRTYNRIEGSERKLSISFLADIGKVIASVVSIAPEKLPSTIRFYSDRMSFDDLAAYCEKKHDIKLKVVNSIPWDQIKTEAEAANAQSDGHLSLTDGSFAGFVTILKALFTSPTHRDVVDFMNNNQNDLVNPNLFNWTKVDL
ncbi:hypothetical protein TRICI_003959 [Trichomonascus ciferrii]|uniref:NmrA-like domain-containing protein n=1 Tax=Trichomonascus ciferrii TaxID=44093 RepID=A0A642V2D7_9ASCO|nr:hypothetical protein TRICI_003959 [Trichomonascus ciferrii]